MSSKRMRAKQKAIKAKIEAETIEIKRSRTENNLIAERKEELKKAPLPSIKDTDYS